MLVLFSQLKKYLPDLNSDVKEVAQVFTFTGQMIDKIIEVEYLGQKDYLLDLEVRQNRADCFGIHGLARELSAHYGIDLKFFNNSALNEGQNTLPIEINARQNVKRVMALELSNIQIKESPEWLKQYLALYNINSINNLVDLTNYVMIQTGIPSHVFDTDLVGQKLVWELNQNYTEITTLNGDKLNLNGLNDLLLISDGKRPLSLSFIGSGVDAVNSSTKNVILEMGVYDGGMVRRNSRRLNVITEAGQRLEKFLDPEMIPEAFTMLVNLIQEHCGAELSSKVFDDYVQPQEKNPIRIRIQKISQIAGIEIELDKSIQILKRLGFEILNQDSDYIEVLRPINRLDIGIEEDCIEEIIRIYGYTNIPTDKLNIEVTKQITPSHLLMIDQINNQMEAKGFDEVRSWVLVEEEKNANANFEEWSSIKVTNSINEEVPFLRQSLSVSLIDQLETYTKNGIKEINIFEIGKVFGKSGASYLEHYSLGMLKIGKDLNSLKSIVESILRYFEINNVYFKESSVAPKTAHPKNSFDIFVLDNESKEVKLGIIYLTNELSQISAVISELDLDKLNDVVLGLSTRSVHEITQKLVELDTNMIFSNAQNVVEEITTKLKNVDNLWKWEIVDNFQFEDKQKVTVRLTYMNLSDSEAKQLNEKIFA